MSKISKINQINLEQKASNFIKTIDTRGKRLDKEKGLYYFEEYLKEKIKNPVGMGIATRDVLKQTPINNPIECSYNVLYLEKNKKIKDLLSKLYEAEAKYPDTHYIREELIDSERVNHGKVTPCLKGFEKFLLKLKLLWP